MMNSQKELHGFDTANCFKKWTLLFFTGFMLEGHKIPWDISNMTLPPNQLQIKYNTYINSHMNTNINVWSLIFKINRKLWFISSILYFLSNLLALVNVFIFAKLMDVLLTIENTNMTLTHITTLCITFAISQLIQSVFGHNHRILSELMALKTRNIIMQLLLNKIMKISINNNNESMGKILNSITTDSDRLYECIQWSVCGTGSWITALITIPISIYLVGYEMLFGYVYLMIVMPIISFFMVNKQKQYLKTGLKFSDERIKLLQEMLNGIRIIKMYAWEIPLIKNIQKFRVKELYNYKLSMFWNVMSIIFYKVNGYTLIVLILMVRMYVFGKKIIFTETYIMILLIHAFRVPDSHMFLSLPKIVNGLLSIPRIQQIFGANTNISSNYVLSPTHNHCTAIIQIDTMDFMHEKDNASCMLKDIKLNVYRHKLPRG